MNEPKHTPPPWKTLHEAGNNGFANTIAGDFTDLPTGERAQYTIGHLGRIGEKVSDVDEANAAFIVRACNAHDELIAALQDFVNGASSNDITSDHDETFANLMRNSREVLAKVKGA